MTQRTTKQQASLEIYCRQMAKALNDAGYDQKATLELFSKVDMSNTQESVKDIFRGCMRILYPTLTSTAEMDTNQIQAVYEAVNRAFGQRAGISLEWPSTEPPMVGDLIPDHLK